MQSTEATNSAVQPSGNLGLNRTLGFWDGLCLLISIIIGSGIFASPGVALDRSGSPGASLIAWSLSGVLSIAAALCYAEVGALIPKTGGDFEYLKEAYGDTCAFSFAWFNFWVSQAGGIAIIATTFGNYIATIFIGLNETDTNSTPSKIAAVLIICAIGAINCRCVKESSFINNILTAAKVIMVFCVVVAGACYAFDDDAIARDNLEAPSSLSGSSVVGFGPAMNACLWAYSGWQAVNFLAEEVINFETRISNIILWGVSAITILYLLTNIAYFCVLSSDNIIDSDAVAIDFGNETSGKLFAGFFALGVAISTAGSLHGTILIASRSLYAASRSGHVVDYFSKLNDAGSPYVAVIAQCTWAIILVLLPGSSFSALLDYTGPANWFYYALTGSTIFYFRYWEPHRVRPYSVVLYPLPPLILIAMSGYIIVGSFVHAPLYVGLAFAFVAISFPVRWLSLTYIDKYGDGNNIDEIDKSLKRVGIIKGTSNYHKKSGDSELLRPGDIQLSTDIT